MNITSILPRHKSLPEHAVVFHICHLHAMELILRIYGRFVRHQNFSFRPFAYTPVYISVAFYQLPNTLDTVLRSLDPSRGRIDGYCATYIR